MQFHESPSLMFSTVAYTRKTAINVYIKELESDVSLS